MVLLALVQAALAAQVALQLDSSDLHQGQSVDLDLTVVDTSLRGVPEISVPEGLQVAFKGQSQQRAIINFQSTLSTTFTYSLTALEPGDYTVGPVVVQTSAGALKSSPVSVHVAPREAGELETLVADIGSVETAWVGQILLYHLRFQTDKRIANGRWSPPDAPGFTPEPSVEPVTQEYELQQDGKALSVLELFCPLRATTPGTSKIPGGVLQGGFAVTQRRTQRPEDRFFRGFGTFDNYRTEVYSAPPLTLQVKPVPTEGRPADATGLVGHFTVQAKASEGQVNVGDTVTLEVTVAGDGDLAGFTLPALDGTSFRVYDDQPVVGAKIEDGHYAATATFKRAIVPQTPGNIDIPPVRLAYFDPTAGAWATAETEPIHLQVGGEAPHANVKTFHGDEPQGVDALGEDILPVRTDAKLSVPPRRELAFGLLAPGAGLLLVQGLGALRRRPSRTVDRRLDFADLPADPEARLGGIEQIFRERVASRLSIAAAGLRREDLAGLGTDAEEAEAIYRELERIRYGGVHGPLPEDRVRAFVERLR